MAWRVTRPNPTQSAFQVPPEMKQARIDPSKYAHGGMPPPTVATWPTWATWATWARFDPRIQTPTGERVVCDGGTARATARERMASGFWSDSL